MTFYDRIMGPRLATGEEAAQKVGPLAGIPMLGLDALSSAAYGPEAALTIMLCIGMLGATFIVPSPPSWSPCFSSQRSDLDETK